LSGNPADLLSNRGVQSVGWAHLELVLQKLQCTNESSSLHFSCTHHVTPELLNVPRNAKNLTQYHRLKKKFNPKREAEKKNESSQRWTERVISRA
jgi:hypothetical protein